MLPCHMGVEQEESQSARETNSEMNFPGRNLDGTLMKVCNPSVVTNRPHTALV